MMEDPRNIGPSTHLLFIAKNIERIGDHATNIAETIHFIVRGHDIEAERPKGDNTSFSVFKANDGGSAAGGGERRG
jgi:phosphate transport system protein